MAAIPEGAVEKLESQLESTLSAMIAIRDKVAHLEKRSMLSNLMCHEFVRMAIQDFDSFQPRGDPTWLLRSLRDWATGYLRVLSKSYPHVPLEERSLLLRFSLRTAWERSESSENRPELFGCLRSHELMICTPELMRLASAEDETLTKMLKDLSKSELSAEALGVARETPEQYRTLRAMYGAIAMKKRNETPVTTEAQSAADGDEHEEEGASASERQSEHEPEASR